MSLWLYISNRELEELGEGLVGHYLEQTPICMGERCIDIEGLAYHLGLKVVYEAFAEDVCDKIGFLSDGTRPLKILRNGRITQHLFPVGTIVLDQVLRQDQESGRCRFTIAHEIAHFVLDRHDPSAKFHRIYDPDRSYTSIELGVPLNMMEAQAERFILVNVNIYLYKKWNTLMYN